MEINSSTLHQAVTHLVRHLDDRWRLQNLSLLQSGLKFDKINPVSYKKEVHILTAETRTLIEQTILVFKPQLRDNIVWETANNFVKRKFHTIYLMFCNWTVVAILQ